MWGSYIFLWSINYHQGSQSHELEQLSGLIDIFLSKPTLNTSINSDLHTISGPWKASAMKRMGEKSAKVQSTGMAGIFEGHVLTCERGSPEHSEYPRGQVCLHHHSSLTLFPGQCWLVLVFTSVMWKNDPPCVCMSACPSVGAVGSGSGDSSNSKTQAILFQQCQLLEHK